MKPVAKPQPFTTWRNAHRCHCGVWGPYGYGSKLEQIQWFCREHRPDGGS